MMHLYSDEPSQFHDGLGNGGSVDSAHVVPSDSQWSYPGLLPDSLLDNTEIFAPLPTQFDSLNDLFAVPAPILMGKSDVDDTLFKPTSGDQFWNSGVSAVSFPQPITEWLDQSLDFDAPPQQDHNNEADTLSIRLKLPNTKAATKKRAAAPKIKQRRSSKTKTTASTTTTIKARKSIARDRGDKPSRNSSISAAAVLLSSANEIEEPLPITKSRVKKRRESTAAIASNLPLPRGASPLVDVGEITPSRMPLRERNGGVPNASGVVMRPPQVVAVASLLDARNLPLMVHRTVPVAVRRSLTAVDTYARQGVHGAPNNYPNITIGVPHSTSNLIQLNTAPVPTFTTEITGAEAVIKPSASRIDRENHEVPLRRRRGMTPLKIVNPDAILRAAFSRRKSRQDANMAGEM
eukprot:m.364228 g.364228  ORF g.364228 m.364228 type:complete len:406 (+) comp28077_c0_seq7:304-1521(+)